MSHQPTPPIQVNSAPVLALWASVVAEALGHPPDTALTLGRYVTSSSARIKARSIGMLDEAMEAWDRELTRLGLTTCDAATPPHHPPMTAGPRVADEGAD